MRALLDVNVVIALLDPDHAFHERAHSWWARHDRAGWASCPITENGVVRIMAHAGYSRQAHFSVSALVGALRTFVAETDHEFWPDDVSMRDPGVIDADRVHGGRQVTDLYLLALAVRHQGRLATFDTSVPISAVARATTRHLAVL